MTDPVRVLIADDHTLFRRGLAGLLNDHAEFEVLAEACSGPEAVQLYQQHHPDVVIMDVHMPQGGGVDAVRKIKREPEAKVLMLTISEKDEDLFSAIRAGADGYLLKNAEPESLFQAIRRVNSGQGVVSPEITATLMRAVADTQPIKARGSLSRRELQVLNALARGSTTIEIAEQLVISENTVKTHVRHILKKLGAANRTEAVSRAASLGLFESRT